MTDIKVTKEDERVADRALCDVFFSAMPIHFARHRIDSQRPLIEALEVFAECCGQIEDDEGDDEWAKFRLTVGAYRNARAAIKQAKGE